MTSPGRNWLWIQGATADRLTVLPMLPPLGAMGDLPTCHLPQEANNSAAETAQMTVLWSQSFHNSGYHRGTDRPHHHIITSSNAGWSYLETKYPLTLTQNAPCSGFASAIRSKKVLASASSPKKTTLINPTTNLKQLNCFCK